MSNEHQIPAGRCAVIHKLAGEESDLADRKDKSLLIIHMAENKKNAFQQTGDDPATN